MEKDFKNINKRFKRNLKKELSNILNLAGLEMVKKTITLQKINNNYAFGKLRKSTFHKVKKNNLIFGANATNKGFQYGITQEFGRKKGKFPNIKDLRKWLVRKVNLGHIKISKDLGRKKSTRINRLTYLIGRAIKNNGIKGKLFYQQGFLTGQSYLNKNIDKIVKKAFNDV